MKDSIKFKQDVKNLITCNNFKRFIDKVKNGDEVKVIIETLDGKKIECKYKELHKGNDLKIIEARSIK